ncbi:hypothetical protein NEFER03_0004 [Nematocida sp. LUAm3]|nr:hypothetical protein NEFER03_0004 [Nematocida sp. LUAm3]KAI5173486.1 hypothetical protein NEFER02_0002 [Nematocida sp. LUAm2]KAI5176679.1 hypothetical protein NEFER01_0004 [Nematocida sp. LUAm1]
MAKSKNHTNTNQSRKNHRNGIKKPKQEEKLPTRGMPKEAYAVLMAEEAERQSHIKKAISYEEREEEERNNPAVRRRRMIQRVGIRKMALNGIYLN